MPSDQYDNTAVLASTWGCAGPSSTKPHCDDSMCLCQFDGCNLNMETTREGRPPPPQTEEKVLTAGFATTALKHQHQPGLWTPLISMSFLFLKMCFCGSECEGMCRLTWVIYKLKCRTCKQTYIGKTSRELRARISEHIRAVEGRGGRSALCRHECREGYEVRICARTQNDPAALRAMEGKMMNKYCPKINIKQEKRAREEARRVATALKKRMGSCNPAKELRLPKDDPDHEDGANEFWMEDSEWFSSELDIEDENGDSQYSEPDRCYGNKECDTVYWHAQYYVLLKAAKVLTIKNPFEFIDLDSEEAIAHNIYKKKERGFWESIWYATPIGVWFDDEKTVMDKFVNFGLDVILTAVTIAIPWSVGAVWMANAGKAGAMGGKLAAQAAIRTATNIGLAFVVINMKVNSSKIKSAHGVPGVKGSRPVILIKNF